MRRERPFGERSGFMVPPVNIGAMRLPEDHDKAVELIRYAIDNGMRYIDTSRGYGESEIKLGKALKSGYREKVILSTKWSPWNIKIEEDDDTSAECTRKRIDESMARLDVDYLDFYQIWSINNRQQYDMAVCKGGMLEGILKAMDEKLVRHTGFTTHDSVTNLLTYINEADWCEIILFTYNLLNDTYLPAIEAAHKKGIGTVIMNPVAGGLLNQQSPVLKSLARRVGADTVPDLAIRYIFSNVNIDAIISGISKISDVDDSFSSAAAPNFSEEQIEEINFRIGEIVSKRKAFCSGCRYCMPCPQDIDIPAIMDMVAKQRYWGFEDNSRKRYSQMRTPGASSCVRCGQCEEKCTQKLEIMDEMAYAVKSFEDKAS